jgi:phosphodiesterase/alkaline phosphatase D-like protein
MLQILNIHSTFGIKIEFNPVDNLRSRSYYIYMKSELKITLLLLFLSGFSWAQIVTHGPVVGGVTDNSAVFVLRTDTSANVQVELSTIINFSQSLLTSAVNTANDSDYFGKVRIEGLEPGTQYFYRAIINTEPVIEEPVRSFVSYPGLGAATTFHFHFGSGQQKGGDPNSNRGVRETRIYDTSGRLGLSGHNQSRYWSVR